MDDYNLSQIVRRLHTTEVAIGAPVIEPAASIPPAEASVQTQSQYHHGIDFKNPFTMSKRVATRPISPHEAANCCLHHLENCLKVGGAYRDRTDDLMLAKQPLSQLS